MRTLKRSISLNGETIGPYQHIYTQITTLINDGPEDLHSIKAEVPKEVSDIGIKINFTFGEGKKTLSKLPSESRVFVNIDLETAGAVQARLSIILQSAEGVRISLSLYIDIRNILPIFNIDPPAVETSITRGSQKTLELRITNIGKITAENISISLPDSPFFFLSSLGSGGKYGNDLGLGTQETALASILVTIPRDHNLGEISGSLYVKSKRTSSEVTFKILIASDTIMNLTIIIEDEYTYFSHGNPLVADAMIMLTNHQKNLHLTKSSLENNGSATFFNLAEDRYEVYVDAPNHGALREVVVTSITTPNITLFLERQAVTYKWSVVPTEVKDVYDIVLEGDLIVNVPMPVLSITPTVVDLGDYNLGLKEIAQFTITNQGLIRADNVYIELPTTHPTLSFSALTEA